MGATQQLLASYGAAPFVGPLDGYASDLLDAFSANFRLLTSHAGGLFRVRESAGNTESVIGCDGAGLFDATAFNAFIGAGQGYGVRWINQTGDNDWVQTGDATKQGQVLLNTVGGGAVLKLDAVNDFYPTLRFLARPFTIYLVEKGVAAGSYRTLSGAYNCILSSHRDTANNAHIQANVSNFNAGVAGPHMLTLVAPAASGATYFVDGVDKTDTPSNTLNWANITLGDSGGFGENANTNACELLIYGAAHSTGTRTAIETILRGLRGF